MRDNPSGGRRAPRTTATARTTTPATRRAVAAQSRYGQPTQMVEAGTAGYAAAKVAQALIPKVAQTVTKRAAGDYVTVAARSAARSKIRMAEKAARFAKSMRADNDVLGQPVSNKGLAREVVRMAEKKAAEGARKKAPRRKPTAAQAAKKRVATSAGQTSITKVTTGYRPMANPATKGVAKRRVGTQGKAVGSVRAKSAAEIARERKRTGEALYDKATYGRRSVNATMPKSVVSKGQKAAGARYAARAKKK